MGTTPQQQIDDDGERVGTTHELRLECSLGEATAELR